LNDFTTFKKSSFSLVRIIQIGIAVSGLIIVFLFQQTDIIYVVTQQHQDSFLQFSVNRAMRLLLNDIFMLMLIAAWFMDKSITKLALVIQLFDFFILLPLYLFFKLTLEGTSEISSPFLSQFHRLIVNPTLMILLIPGVYFQRLINKHE